MKPAALAAAGNNPSREQIMLGFTSLNWSAFEQEVRNHTLLVNCQVDQSVGSHTRKHLSGGSTDDEKFNTNKTLKNKTNKQM